MELIRKPIHYTKEGKRIFDQFYLDEDYNGAGRQRRRARIDMGNARVKTEEIRLVENYVRITGKVYFQILYVTATGDPKPAVLEGKLPFEEMVYTEGGEDETWFIQNVRTEFTASVVHSRKLSLRVMVEMEIGRERLEDEETTVDIESDVPGLQKEEEDRSSEAGGLQKGYIPDQGGDHTAGDQGEYRTDPSHGCGQQEAGDPAGGRMN